MLWTRGVIGGSPKAYNFVMGVPSIELESYSAYMLPAGAEGSVDWLTEHCTYAHVNGPGEEWDHGENSERYAWVFRAIKPSHAQWYENRVAPHAMMPPSYAARIFGGNNEE